MLARIYGVYKVNIKWHPAIYFMLMENTVRVEKPVSHLFDLKGSFANRKIILENQKANSAKLRKVCKDRTLKDQDFVYLQKFRTPNLINLAAFDRKEIVEAVEADAAFLETQGLMDYSLLLGVEVIDKRAMNIKQ